MAIGVGSIGDVIALVLLVRDCANALSDARGSSAAYQAVVRELWLLEKALLEIDILCQTYNDAPELDSICDAAREVVEGCRKSLEAFKAKSKKFGPYLGEGAGKGAKQKVAGGAMKLLYAVSQKDETARFRAEVVTYSVSINQILATATLHVLKTGQDRIEEQLRAATAATNTNVKELKLQLSDVNKRIGQTSGILAARLEWLSKLGADLKSMMQKLLASNLAMLAAIGDLQKSVALLTSSATQSLNSEPKIMFEDALGRVFPITLQWISCWDMFDSVLQLHFKDMQGSGKVAKKEYVLTNRATGKDLDLSKQLDRVFLPDQFVQMYMVFQKTFEVEPGVPEDDGDSCPNCEAPSNQPKGLEVKCSVCGLIYKRMTEEGVKDDGTAVQRPTVPDAPNSGLNVPQGSLEDTASRNLSASRLDQSQPPRPVTAEIEDEMSSFKRVRLIAKRLLKQAPAVPAEEDEWTSLVTSNVKKSKKKKKKLGGQQAATDDTAGADEPVTENDTDEWWQSFWSTARRNWGSDDGPSKPEHDTSQADDAPRRPSAASQYSEDNYPYSPWPGHTSRSRVGYRRSYYPDYPESESPYGRDHAAMVPYRPRPTSPKRERRNSRSYVPPSEDYGNPSTGYYHPPPDRLAYEYQSATASAHIRNSSRRHRRQSTARRSSTSTQASENPRAKKKKSGPPPRREATAEDAAAAGIPDGYSTKHWDPAEEPILLLGSVFDANTLGKWIYDWTVFIHGSNTPFAEVAGDLWLLLIKLAGSLKRADEAFPKIRNRDSAEMVEDFLESGERLLKARLSRLLKVCEGYMLKASPEDKDATGPTAMERGKIFVETIFGRDRELETCQKWMSGARLWTLRFEANCEDILRNPDAA